VAINLLFLEAYHNYIKCLYPCATTDATVLAGILMQINNGDYDPMKPVSEIIKYENVWFGLVVSIETVVLWFVNALNLLIKQQE